MLSFEDEKQNYERQFKNEIFLF